MHFLKYNLGHAVHHLIHELKKNILLLNIANFYDFKMVGEEAQDFRFLDPACMVYSHCTDFVRNVLPTALRLSNPKRGKNMFSTPKLAQKRIQVGGGR